MFRGLFISADNGIHLTIPSSSFFFYPPQKIQQNPIENFHSVLHQTEYWLVTVLLVLNNR